MKSIICLLIILGGLLSVASSVLAQIENIGELLDECPNNDPAYLQIIEDFKIRNDGILVDVENILCYEPVSQMDILDYSDELIALQGLKVIYYMDSLLSKNGFYLDSICALRVLIIFGFIRL